jgi:hypothetical protein
MMSHMNSPSAAAAAETPLNIMALLYTVRIYYILSY